MGNCTEIFAEMQELLPAKLLAEVTKTGKDSGNPPYSVLQQLNTLMYAHLKESKGLRKIEAGIKADRKLQKYTGSISFSQISRVNSSRDVELFKSVYEQVFSKLRKHNGIRNLPGSYGTLKILDSTLVRVCLNLFPWATYQKTTAGVKIHTLYNLLVDAPERILLTEGKVHDRKKMGDFVTEPGVTYIIDRGYVDYGEYERCCENGIFFVSRLKDKASVYLLEENPVKDGENVLSDEIVVLGTGSKQMKHPVRVVQVTDSSNGEKFYIVTNRFDLSAEEIADIYRLRWTIETFFRWIKQNLKIKHFFGTTLNAVLIQIFSALILFCLLKIIQVLHFKNFVFSKLVHLISNNIWLSRQQILECLTPKRPPPKEKQKRLNWKKDFQDFYNRCGLNITN